MTHNIIFRALSVVVLLTLVALPAFAGGALDNIDITNAPPSPIAGQVIAKIIGIKWDTRCMPVHYSMNHAQPHTQSTGYGTDRDCGAGTSGLAGFVRCMEHVANLIH
jgi:hypothetical protein